MNFASHLSRWMRLHGLTHTYRQVTPNSLIWRQVTTHQLATPFTHRFHMIATINSSIPPPTAFPLLSLPTLIRSFSTIPLNQFPNETNMNSSGCGNASCGCKTSASSNDTTSASASNDSMTPSSAANGGCGSSSCACKTGGSSGGGCASSTAVNSDSPPTAEEEAARVAAMEAALTELKRLNSEVNRFHSLGQYEDALEHANEARLVAQELFGFNHPGYASTLNNIALFQRIHRQNYDEAAKLYETAADIYRQTVGETSGSYLTCLNNLALTYRSLGDLTRAHTTLTQVLETYDRIIPVHERKTALPLAQSQMSLAGVLVDRGDASQNDLTRAIELYNSALKIVKRKYGEEHPLVATILNNLALTYKSQQAYSTALPLYQLALKIRSNNLPPTHPDLIISLNNLAECLIAMGETEKSQAVQQKILDIMNFKPDQAEAK